ncbi:MAG TPA: hypothetical protein VMT89_17250, partial [Candidatus Acidoferrales bacterium]|nr:hypothetical protein [Candidatus Acidoferrales bacterium]
ILRCCREDGELVKPDVPIAAVDRCFQANGFLRPEPLIGECYSLHPAGYWSYVTSFNACQTKHKMQFEVRLADLGATRPLRPVIVYDWRRRSFQRTSSDESWTVDLEFQDWDYRIVCPLLSGDMTVFGDVGKYACVGDRRIARISNGDGEVHFQVRGAPHTCVEVHGYAAQRPLAVRRWTPDGASDLNAGEPPESDTWLWNAGSGEWIACVAVGNLGWVDVTIVGKR